MLIEHINGWCDVIPARCCLPNLQSPRHPSSNFLTSNDSTTSTSTLSKLSWTCWVIVARLSCIQGDRLVCWIRSSTDIFVKMNPNVLLDGDQQLLSMAKNYCSYRLKLTIRNPGNRTPESRLTLRLRVIIHRMWGEMSVKGSVFHSVRVTKVYGALHADAGNRTPLVHTEMLTFIPYPRCIKHSA